MVAQAKAIGAQAYLTGEAKHHEMLYSAEAGISLFVAGHFETENVVCERLGEYLKKKFGDKVEICVSTLKHPVNYI